MGVNKEGSIGLPLPDVECRLISLEDGVTDLGLGTDQIGELAIRGPQVFKGYWNMPTETNNTPQADPAGGGACQWRRHNARERAPAPPKRHDRRETRSHATRLETESSPEI